MYLLRKVQEGMPYGGGCDRQRKKPEKRYGMHPLYGVCKELPEACFVKRILSANSASCRHAIERKILLLYDEPRKESFRWKNGCCVRIAERKQG